jgi:hypothetical protein
LGRERLAANLRRRSGASRRRRAYRKRSTSSSSARVREAIGSRGHWLAFERSLAWQLKDWIDRRCIRRFA